jgi:hypothetical protein
VLHRAAAFATRVNGVRIEGGGHRFVLFGHIGQPGIVPLRGCGVITQESWKRVG